MSKTHYETDDKKAKIHKNSFEICVSNIAFISDYNNVHLHTIVYAITIQSQIRHYFNIGSCTSLMVNILKNVPADLSNKN